MAITAGMTASGPPQEYWRDFQRSPSWTTSENLIDVRGEVRFFPRQVGQAFRVAA